MLPYNQQKWYINTENLSVVCPINTTSNSKSIIGSGLKVGRKTRTIWVTWVTFLVGQVGLIHKLNYLDVTRIFNRSHVL